MIMKENGPTLVALFQRKTPGCTCWILSFILGFIKNSLCQSGSPACKRVAGSGEAHMRLPWETQTLCSLPAEWCSWCCTEGSGLDIAGYERRLSIPFHLNAECWKCSCWTNSVDRTPPPSTRLWKCLRWPHSHIQYVCVHITSQQIQPTFPLWASYCRSYITDILWGENFMGTIHTPGLILWVTDFKNLMFSTNVLQFDGAFKAENVPDQLLIG